MQSLIHSDFSQLSQILDSDLKLKVKVEIPPSTRQVIAGIKRKSSDDEDFVVRTKSEPTPKELPKRERKTRFYFKDDDYLKFHVLTELVNKLKKDFPRYSTRFIVQALHEHSCNILHTFYFLLNPKKNCGFLSRQRIFGRRRHDSTGPFR